MTEKPPIRIATISDNPDPDWAWLSNVEGAYFKVAGRSLTWRSFSMAHSDGQRSGFSRLMGARRLAGAGAEQAFDLIVSHGPWTTAWTEWIGRHRETKHLAFSFNFTDLPAGPRKALMSAAFRKVDAFAVFTEAEQALYADYFGIDQSRLLRAPWGVAPPINTPVKHAIDGEYYAALGGEARDYHVLCDAARLCPDLKFCAIARPHNFYGLDVPQNLRVLFNLPIEEAWSIIWDAKAALLPLRNRETPCGLVTLVGAMHLGKAQIAASAVGASEYLRHEETGLLVPPGDAEAIAAAIRRLEADPSLAARLGDAARAEAAAHCSEAATVAFFRELMESWFGEK